MSDSGESSVADGSGTFCLNCGSRLGLSQAFCTSCGTAAGAVATPEAVPSLNAPVSNRLPLSRFSKRTKWVLAGGAGLAVLVILVVVVIVPLVTGSGTAMSSKRIADRAARDWDSEAELAYVHGGEGPGGFRYNPFTTESEPYLDEAIELAERDRDVGDGRAEIWVYYYTAPTSASDFNGGFIRFKPHYEIAVADGRIIWEGEQTRDSARMGEPFDSWRVDSHEAMKAARRTDSAFKSPDHVTLELSQEIGSDVLAWKITTERARIWIDADNGGILDFQTIG